MKKPKLFWQIFPSFLIVLAIALLASTWHATRAMRELYLSQIRNDLKVRALLLKDRIAQAIASSDFETIDTLCKKIGHMSSTRITVILPSGQVVGDSEKNPKLMDNHSDRPEIIQAISKGLGSSIRYSHTLKREMMYVAIPIEQPSGTYAVLRTSVQVASLVGALHSVYLRIASGGMIIAFLVVGLALMLSRRLSKPLEEMRKSAEHFSKGELDHRLPVPNSEEMGSLAKTLNQMAEQLDERLRTITRQRNELEAVLTSMVEGVIAVDSDGRILSINRAAADMMGITTKPTGKHIEEIIRNNTLKEFVLLALSASKPVEDDMVIDHEGRRFIQTHGTPLRDASGSTVGAVIVLNDITRLKRLESIQRDFVANVSHELRTPITVIKGFVETLLEGMVKNNVDIKRFLSIVSRQVDRLNAIIEDLLLLSKLEQDSEGTDIKCTEALLEPILTSAVETCLPQAKDKNIKITIQCERNITVKVNSSLLKQAVVNLLDNAIKYSYEGSKVAILAYPKEDNIIIDVQDNGPGIDQKHIPRLFERFYRVDKARSRKLGGTGLGLAIVKHIAQIHGGSVTVKSTPGKGSTFSILLPNT